MVRALGALSDQIGKAAQGSPARGAARVEAPAERAAPQLRAAGGVLDEAITLLREARAQAAAYFAELTPCPNCGALNPPDSNFCPKCGFKLEIHVDEARKAREVAEITETEYFERLRSQATAMRRRPHGRGP
jgi:ribosomal protein L40E